MSKIDKSRRDEMRSLRSYMVSESAYCCSCPWVSATANTIRRCRIHAMRNFFGLNKTSSLFVVAGLIT